MGDRTRTSVNDCGFRSSGAVSYHPEGLSLILAIQKCHTQYRFFVLLVIVEVLNNGSMIEWLLKLCLTVVSSSLVGLCFYRAALSPLSKLPGPWCSLFSDIYLVYKEFTGKRRVYIHELHKTFGPVVRIGPKEVSFTSPKALKEIYQLGGSGYDKTKFYELFMQYDTRCAAFATVRRTRTNN
jgi:hypothetical protein